MSSSIIAIIIAAITIVLFMWNKLPMSVVAMGSSVAMGILIPQMELSEVYAGFSAPGWAMVVGMCIVSAALFETGMAQKIGDRIGNSFLAKTERRFIVTASAVCCLMSAFMSNNGTVAIWMPLIAVVAAGSNGRIRSKMVIFPAGTAAIIGGGACTLVGSTSQLAANAVLQGYDGYKDGLGMFDMTKIMLPAAIVQVVFWGTIGYTLLKKVLKPESPDFNVGNMYADAPAVEEKSTNDPADGKKGAISVFTMLLCIFLFVASGFEPFKSHFTIGVIGMLGAVIVLGTKCIPVKKAYEELPWDVLITIGGIGGLGAGLDKSGGGALIANAVLNLFGGKNASVVVLTIVIAVLTSVLTNFMSNNATAAMISPIAIAMALGLGISPVPWVIVIAACSNLAIATSFNMQILPAGYKFSDFVKIGGPLLIILIAVVTVSSVAFLF